MVGRGDGRGQRQRLPGSHRRDHARAHDASGRWWQICASHACREGGEVWWRWLAAVHGRSGAGGGRSSKASIFIQSHVRAHVELMWLLSSSTPIGWLNMSGISKRSHASLEFDNPERPECRNLLSINQIITGKTKEEVVSECQYMNWGAFKTTLTDALIEHLHPVKLAGVHWHGFTTFQNLRDSLAHKRANRRWVDGNEAIAVHLNPDHFVSNAYDDGQFNTDMDWRLISLAHYEQMRVNVGANDNAWPNYQCQNNKYGPLDLEQHEVKGDLRCRRRLVFPPEVAHAIGAEPFVLLQYKRWPFCYPQQHRLELLIVVEAIEAAEAAAANALEGVLHAGNFEEEAAAAGDHDGAEEAEGPAGGEAAGDGAAPAGGEAAVDGAAPAGGEAAADGAEPAGGEAAVDGAAPAGGEAADE
nr:unnamed protein product [Digitaria exilis]